MTLENAIRIMAGAMVLASLLLSHFGSPHWLWLAAFVGANLIQSAFTHFCPAEIVLRKMGIGSKGAKGCCS